MALTTRWPDGPGENRIPGQSPKLNEVWGGFLGRVPWQYFVTLTFDVHRTSGVGKRQADREARRWCDDIARLARRSVDWLYALERHKSGQWHAHVLLTAVDQRSVDVAVQVWNVRNGRADLVPVWDGGGAVRYASKDTLRGGEIVFSDTLYRYHDRLRSEVVIDLIPSTDDSRVVGQAGTNNGNVAPRAGRDVQEELVLIRRAARAAAWPGSGGSRREVLLAAHVQIAEATGSLTYHADVRTLAIAAGLSPKTVAKLNGQLLEEGWLQLLHKSNRSAAQANVWVIPARLRAEAAGVSGSGVEKTSTPAAQADSCRANDRPDLGADVWRHRALGKAAFRVWNRLSAANPISEKGLAQMLARTGRAVRTQLTKLERQELVVRDGTTGWLRGKADLARVAESLGTAGERQRQEARHDAERGAFRTALAERNGLTMTAVSKQRTTHGLTQGGESV